MRSRMAHSTSICLIVSSLCCLLPSSPCGFVKAQEVYDGVQSQLPAGRTPWGELDLDWVLNRPLNANRVMSRLRTDRKFLDNSAISDPIRSQAVEGTPYLWEESAYTWYSPAFCHSPLYFEQPNLERYGQGPRQPWASPASAGRFLGQVTTLPLAVIWSPPWSRSCTQGHHRPGNLAPWQRKSLSR
jgi:hypothetical protein